MDIDTKKWNASTIIAILLLCINCVFCLKLLKFAKVPDCHKNFHHRRNRCDKIQIQLGSNLKMSINNLKYDPDNCDESEFLSFAKESKDHFQECGLHSSFSSNDQTFEITSKKSNDLNDIEKEQIFSLFEINMKSLYEQTWGWKPIEKKKELFLTDSRFLLIYSIDQSKKEGSTDDGVIVNSIAGYTMFRFEWDDEEEPEFPVLYCYELQICKAMQGNKLGKHVSGFVSV